MSDMKWYVVHTYSGMEKSAESALRERIAREGLQDCFEEILVPTEDISEVKNGKKRVSTRRMYSGYIFVKMIMNDETWHLVKNTAELRASWAAVQTSRLRCLLRTLKPSRAKWKPVPRLPDLVSNLKSAVLFASRTVRLQTLTE